MRKIEFERHRLAGVLVLAPDRIGMDELALAGDHDHRSRQLALIDLALERLPNALELLLGHSDLFGRRLRQRQSDIGPYPGRGQHKGAEQGGAEHRSLHDLAPPNELDVCDFAHIVLPSVLAAKARRYRTENRFPLFLKML